MNAKERMKAYLEKLRNMEPDEIVELKARYNKFSESYDTKCKDKEDINERYS